MRFGTILREHRKTKGLTLEKLAEKIGSSKAYLSEIESGQRPAPKDRFVKSLSKALGVRQSELLRLAHFERIHPDVKDDLLKRDAIAIAEMLASEPRKEPAREKSRDAGVGSRTVYVPLLNSIASGYPKGLAYIGLPRGEVMEHLRIPSLGDTRAFALTVCDDSMRSDGPVSFRKGDIIIVSPKAKVSEGDLAFVAVGTRKQHVKCLFRKVFFEGGKGYFLKPLNEKHGTSRHAFQEVKGIWKVVAKYGLL